MSVCSGYHKHHNLQLDFIEKATQPTITNDIISSCLKLFELYPITGKQKFKLKDGRETTYFSYNILWPLHTIESPSSPFLYNSLKNKFFTHKDRETIFKEIIATVIEWLYPLLFFFPERDGSTNYLLKIF